MEHLTTSKFTSEVLSRGLYYVNYMSYGRRSYGGRPTRILELGKPYTYCPAVPQHPSELRENASMIWNNFWELIRNQYQKSATVTFSAKDHTYNVHAGKVAIVIKDELIVARSEDIDLEVLKDQGFVQDSNLGVPFSFGEGYYSEDDDHNCNDCGLIYW